MAIERNFSETIAKIHLARAASVELLMHGTKLPAGSRGLFFQSDVIGWKSAAFLNYQFNLFIDTTSL